MNLKHPDVRCSANETSKTGSDPSTAEEHQRASRAIMLKWLNGEGLLESEVAVGGVNPTEKPIEDLLRVKRPNPKGTISDGDIYHATIIRVIDILPVVEHSAPTEEKLAMVKFTKSTAAQKEVQITRFKK